MKKISIFLVMAVSLIFVGRAEATSYHAYTGVSSLGNLSASVFLVGDILDSGTNFSMNADWDISLAYGFANYSDFYMSPNGWGVIRTDLSKGKSLAIIGLYLEKPSWGNWGFHYHAKPVFSDAFALEINVIATTTYQNAFDTVNLTGIIAPVISLGGASLYCEINPTYSLDTTGAGTGVFDLQLLPGVGFGVGEGYFSIGVEFNNLISDNALDINFKSWYWFDFGIDKIGEE